jgi:hypothetical protein
MSLTHGVSTSHGYTGPVQNFRTAKEGEQALARDANGDVQETTEYNLMRVVEFDWLLDSGDTAPAYGNTITVAGSLYKVETSEKTEGNTEYAKYAITARRWTVNSYPAS